VQAFYLLLGLPLKPLSYVFAVRQLIQAGESPNASEISS
jgi:hypothetical protein